MKRYALSDFSSALPSRYELGQMKFRHLHSRNYKWNNEHYHRVDFFFLHNNPLAEHYRAFMKALSPTAQKSFKGTLLSQMLKLMLVYLEYPQRCGGNAIVVTLKGVSIWKATFIRKYLGVIKNWDSIDELEALPEITANMPKYDVSKKKMIDTANSLFDLIHHRAIELQPKFREQVVGIYPNIF
ncbi:MAG: hypothetical protein WC272_09670 [Sulfurimonas sp.]|jgi:hypothetical protein